VASIKDVKTFIISTENWQIGIACSRGSPNNSCHCPATVPVTKANRCFFSLHRYFRRSVDVFALMNNNTYLLTFQSCPVLFLGAWTETRLISVFPILRSSRLRDLQIWIMHLVRRNFSAKFHEDWCRGLPLVPRPARNLRFRGYTTAVSKKWVERLWC